MTKTPTQPPAAKAAKASNSQDRKVCSIAANGDRVTHSSIQAASKWLLDNGHTKSPRSNIALALKTKGECLKFKWEYVQQPDLPDEEWRPIIIADEDTGELVSNMGRVRHATGVIVEPIELKSRQTPEVTIGGTKYAYGRLVAAAFIANPMNRPVVGHRNFVAHDCRVSNLYWATTGEILTASYETGERNTNSRPVVQFDAEGNDVVIARFKSMTDAAAATGVAGATLTAKLDGAGEARLGEFVFKLAENV